MKIRRILTVLLAGGALSVLSAASLKPVDEAGYARLIREHRGKVLLVNFWATWCVPCRTEMPELAALERRLAPLGFQLLTISADEPEQEAAAATFLKKAGIRGPAYWKRTRNDDRFINSVDPGWSGALPALIVYDRNGKKVSFHQGETDLKTLEAAIRRLL